MPDPSMDVRSFSSGGDKTLPNMSAHSGKDPNDPVVCVGKPVTLVRHGPNA